MQETQMDRAKIGIVRRGLWTYRNYCPWWDSHTGEKSVFGRDYGTKIYCNPEICATPIKNACREIREALALIEENIGRAREYLDIKIVLPENPCRQDYPFGEAGMHDECIGCSGEIHKQCLVEYNRIENRKVRPIFRYSGAETMS